MSGRLVLVESAEHLPGLFPLQAWEALQAAERVHVRDLAHPAAVFLQLAGLEVVEVVAERAAVVGASLLEPGDPQDRAIARALMDLAASGGATYLLGPADGDAFTRTVGLAAARAHVEVEFVFLMQLPRGHQVLRLAAIEARLRDPVTGCPWDLEQDHRSLARFLVEETYELLDAIDAGDDAAMTEELGDVLLQVVFHAQMGADRGAFDLDDVARGISDKLVHRHPHVFGDVEVTGAREVMANWEVLKQEEKGERGPFEGVPSALPALQLTEKLHRRAAKLGVGPEGTDAAAAVREALARVADGAPDDVDTAVGELLRAVVSLAREHEVDPEQALRRAATRFRADAEATLAARARS